MKSYPSIPQFDLAADSGMRLHTFAKLDGSNLRFEWSAKRGWYKVGTRDQLLDSNNPVFAPALPIFQCDLAEPLERLARAQRWLALVCFCEYWGEHSFAGQHDPADEMRLSVIDLSPYKVGILGPERFLRLTDGLPVAPYLGERVWNERFALEVRAGELSGMSFEGVVGKAGDRHQIQMRKLKSTAWVARVRERYGAKAEALI